MQYLLFFLPQSKISSISTKLKDGEKIFCNNLDSTDVCKFVILDKYKSRSKDIF